MNDTNDATSGNSQQIEKLLFAGSNPAPRTSFSREFAVTTVKNINVLIFS
jgi:hypothetical protein